MRGEELGAFWLDPSSQRIRLKAEFPSIIVCPGSTGRFGKSDESGMLYVMGAAGGYTDAKRILRRWHEKQQDPTVQWWVDYMEKKSIEPITVSIAPNSAVVKLALAGSLTLALAVSFPLAQTHEVLDGISYSRWASYAAAYGRARSVERVRKFNVRKRARIIEEKEHDYGVARELLELGQGGGGSRASSGE